MKSIENMLENWAEWLKAGYSRSIGYPTIAAFLIVHSDFTPAPAPENEEAETLDRAIAKMPKRLSKVIFYKYYRGYSDRQGGRTLNMDGKTFKVRVQSALIWLENHLK